MKRALVLVISHAAAIAMQSEIAPGPDYKLCLSPDFVETEADFTRLKGEMARAVRPVHHVCAVSTLTS